MITVILLGLVVSLLIGISLACWIFANSSSDLVVWDTRGLANLTWKDDMMKRWGNVRVVLENYKAQGRVLSLLKRTWSPSKDSAAWHHLWGDLLSSAKRTDLVPWPASRSLENLRNAYAHCNFWSIKFKNDGTKSELENLLPPSTIPKLKSTDWLIWNVHQDKGKSKVVFCFVIDEQELRQVLKQFESKCKTNLKQKEMWEPPVAKMAFAIALPPLCWIAICFIVYCLRKMIQ